MTGFFRGLATAMITPFSENGVDFDTFGEMLDYQIAGGADAVVVIGTTGEPSTMSDEEKGDLVRYAVEKAAGRIKIIVGTGGNDTKKAVLQSIAAQKAGADGVLVVTPYYNKCTQNGLYLYYKEIAEAVSIPVICYNVPSRTGVNILPETMARIAEIHNIAGIKEASGNMAQVMETARLIRGKCALYSGEDALNLPILAAGGVGVISVVSNLCPAKVKKLVELVLNGKLKEANAVSDALLPLADACFSEVNPIPVKAGMNLLGFAAGTPRAPLTEIEDVHKTELIRAMKEVGLEVNA